MKIKILFVCFLLIIGACAKDINEVKIDNAKFDIVKMDRLFLTIERNQQGMGSISIFEDGIEVYQNSFGYADIGNNIMATANTKYRIGSISKTFTAAIVMQLIDENKLTLSTKVDNFFPEVPNADRITIEHLLRHRSGLFNLTNALDYLSWMENPMTKPELLQKIVTNGTIFEPNERALYSNTNYILLSLIVEKIEDKEFLDILCSRITLPLQLKNTYYGGKINSTNHEAFSYVKTNVWTLATETDMSIPLGAGAIVTNPTDLNTFYNALFTCEIVSCNTLMEMKRIIDDYGIGLFPMNFYDKIAFGHTGGIDGFRSCASYFPIENVTIAYTSNGSVIPMNDI